LCISRIFRKLERFLPQVKMWGDCNRSWHDERNSLNCWVNSININCNILSSGHFRNWLISVRFITARSGSPVRTVIMWSIWKTGESEQRFFFPDQCCHFGTGISQDFDPTSRLVTQNSNLHLMPIPLHKHRDSFSLTAYQVWVDLRLLTDVRQEQCYERRT
jgi:hypothetical protein